MKNKQSNERVEKGCGNCSKFTIPQNKICLTCKDFNEWEKLKQQDNKLSGELRDILINLCKKISFSLEGKNQYRDEEMKKAIQQINRLSYERARKRVPNKRDNPNEACEKYGWNDGYNKAVEEFEENLRKEFEQE